MDDWKSIAVKPDTPIRQTLSVIDRGSKQIALVVDPDGCHLLGTITDGDIRRALLQDKGLDTASSEIMNKTPITGLAEEAPEIWQRTMARNQLKHLPLLNAQGCLHGLVRYQPPTEPSRDNPVVLMAGGLGSRLRPLTNTVPKPLLKIGPRPVLETIIEGFAKQGFCNIYLCINYKGELIKDHFGDGSRWEVNIQYVEEDKRLGTAGALSLLPEKPQHPLIVMNGDLLTKVDFVRLLDFHQQQGFAGTMAMREYTHQVPYGVLELGDGYRVQRLVEKPIQRHYVNTGIYVLDPDTIDHIPHNEYFDMPALFEKLLGDNKPVGSFPLRDYWVDIGRLEDLEKAHLDFGETFL